MADFLSNQDTSDSDDDSSGLSQSDILDMIKQRLQQRAVQNQVAQQQSQGNPLANIAMGLASGVAGGLTHTPGNALYNNIQQQNANRAIQAARLQALDGAPELKALSNLAVVNAKNQGGLASTLARNQGALENTMARNQGGIDRDSNKFDWQSGENSLNRDAAKQNMLTKLDIGHQNQMNYLAGLGVQKEDLTNLENTYRAVRLKMDQDFKAGESQKNRDSQWNTLNARLSSLEKIALENNKTKENVAANNNQTKENVATNNNQTSVTNTNTRSQTAKDVAALNGNTSVTNTNSRNQTTKDVAAGNNKTALGVAQIRASTAANKPQGAMSDRVQNQTNSAYDKTVGPTENTIRRSNTVLHILDQIDQGGLKSTPTLKGELTSALDQMFSGGQKPPTVHGQQQQDVNTAYGRLQSAYTYLTGNPADTIPKNYLDQIRKDVGALRDAYSEQHANSFGSWVNGVPDATKQKMINRYNFFRAAELGDNAGYTGKPSLRSNLKQQSSSDYSSGGAGTFNSGGLTIDPTKWTREQKLQYLKGK